MRCAVCSHDNRETAAFCEACGAKLTLVCSRGSDVLRPGPRFCEACGQPIAAPVAPCRAAALAQQPHPPPTAVSLGVGNSLEGERKQVTILFADIVGSTELIRDRDPEEAQALLDGAVTRMMDAVHRYGGTVSRLLGDGLMALFGAPIAHEDHALRACHAALAVQEATRAYADDLQRSAGVSIQARVGLNSGEVVVRVISSDIHADYTAMGQAVHLAARLEQGAEPGHVHLSAEVLRLVDGAVEARSLGRVAVKGLEGPVEVFDLIGAGAAPTRLAAAASRGFTAFVGRRDEREAIEAALARARDGHGGVVALVGEAGVGKSRLVREVVRSPATEGWSILETGAVSYGTTTPYLPIVAMLRSWCGIARSDDVEAVGRKLTARLKGLDLTLEAVRAPLLDLLDVSVDEAEWRGLEPGDRRRRTLDALVHLLVRAGDARPLLLVVEDLQWIDTETRALLDGLLDRLPTARVLLLVNFRPEYVHAWGNKRHDAHLRLGPLGRAPAYDLLAAILGEDDSLADLKRLLVDRTGGNPFFLEEAVRSMVETGVLVGRRGAYRATGSAGPVHVPATVQAVLAARIDRLAPSEKRLLQAAAVVGEHAPLPLLRAVADRAETELHASLSRLRGAGLLYESAVLPEPEWSFHHALTHEVAYGGLLRQRRRELHRRVVDGIKAAFADRLDEQIERLAHHAFRAEDWPSAADYAWAAGRKSAARSAERGAVAFYDQALAASEKLPETRQVVERCIDIRLDLQSSLYHLGEFGQVAEQLGWAEARASALDDQARLLEIYSRSLAHDWAIGEYGRAADLGGRAVALIRTTGDSSALPHFITGLGMVAHARGRHSEALSLLAEAAASLDAVPRDQSGRDLAGLRQVATRHWTAWSLAETGRFAEALTQATSVLEFAEQLNRPSSLATAHFDLGHLHVRRGNFDEAVRVLERGAQRCYPFEIPIWSDWITATLGYASAFAGRIDAGLAMIEQSVPLATVGRTVLQTALFVWLGEAYLVADRIDDARQTLLTALNLSLGRGERGQEAYARRALGNIVMSQDSVDPSEAESHHQRALALAEELGMHPLQAHCHLGLGKLNRKVGRREEARAELTTAIAMLREMGMTFWLPEAELELAEAGG